MLVHSATHVISFYWHRVRKGLPVCAAIAFCACTDGDRVSPVAPMKPSANAIPANGLAPDTSRYIVAFKSSVVDANVAGTGLARAFGGQRMHLFTTGRKAVVLRGLSADAVAALRALPNVEYVERDRIVRLATAQSLPVNGSQWALDRIDEPDGARVFNNTFNYYFTGAGVHVYIVDTGIDQTNPDVAGRLSPVAICTFNGGGCDPYADTFGHGTAVASLAAGSTYGVAKGATLHSIRVGDGEGTFESNIGAGLDWLRVNGVHPGVVNISLGDPTGDMYLDDGIRRFLSEKINEVIQTGYVVVKAAGNTGTNACNDPQDTQQGEIVVAASDFSDNRANWGGPSSNYGGCISLFAPGSNVAATPTALGTALSGTSVAAPMVAGVAAQILQEQPSLNSEQVLSQLLNSANRVINDPSTPNNFLVNALHQTADPLAGRTTIQSTDLDQTTDYHVTVYGGDSNNWSFVWAEQNHTNFATQATSSGAYYHRTVHAGESGWTTIMVQATSAGRTLTRSTTLTISYGECNPAC